jgi:hypothetical protein
MGVVPRVVRGIGEVAPQPENHYIGLWPGEKAAAFCLEAFGKILLDPSERHLPICP